MSSKEERVKRGGSASTLAKKIQKSDDKPLSSVLYFDSNTYKLWAVSLFAFYLSYSFLNLFFVDSSFFYYCTLLFTYLITWLIFSIMIDTLYYVYGYQFYDSRLTVIRGYSVSCYTNDTLHSVGLDYGFNFYDGNYNKPRDQAQIDKFEYAIAALGIKKGDKVLDVGCGCGDWLMYLKTQYNCDVYGINITLAQTKECHERGLTNVYCTDWKDVLKEHNKNKLQKIFYDKFDAVSFWDTVEHYVSMGEGLGRRHNRYKVYGNMFKLAKLCLNRDSKHKSKMKVWISCLHMRREVWTTPYQVIKAWLLGTEIVLSDQTEQGTSTRKMPLKELAAKLFYVYLLDKFHSGFYPSYYFDRQTGKFHDELVENGEMQGFKLVKRKDTTMDYYMTSVLNPTHFGRHHYSMSWNRFVANALSIFVDPFWLHRRLWFMQESWMYQFDPNDLENSDVILWWLIFQLDD